MTLKLLLIAQAQTDFVQRLKDDLREKDCEFVPRLSLADRLLLIDDATLPAEARFECKPVVYVWHAAAAQPHPEALDFRLAASIADYTPRFDQLLKRLHRTPEPHADIFGLPNLPERYLERPELQTVYQSLFQSDERVNAIVSQAPLNALIGIGGIGKSTLANALCRLCAVRREFYDGVIWITLGKDSPTLSALRTLGSALQVPSESLSEEGAAKMRLQQELAKKRCLVVLDDVWDHKIAAVFKQLIGNASHLLITTRKHDIAHLLGARTDTLDALSAEQGADLLCQYVPQAPRPIALQIADQLGGHPLAIFIAACWITEYTDRDAQQLLERLQKGKTFETLNMADDDRSYHLELSLRLSYDDLRQDDDRKRFRFLGALAPNASFDAAALAALWQLEQDAARDAVVNLLRAGLLTRDETDKRYRMHSLLHAYAYKLLATEASGELHLARQNHFEHFFAKRERQRAERAQLSADLPNILRALAFALDYDPRAAVDWTMKLAKPMRGMPTAERRALLEQGLEAARRTRNTVGEAFLLRALYDVVRQPEERARYRQQALDAFAQLERAAAHGAQRAITFQVYALLQKELRNFDEARRLFKRAVEADPSHAPSWQAYALFEKEQRNFDEARRLFQRAVEADPSHAPAWQAYALFEKEQRQYAEARRLFGRAVEADPFNAPSWQAYALFEKEQRQYDEARRLFKRAVEADPFNAPAWQAYALFEKEQRQYDEARRLFKRAVEADPSHAPAWQAYALFEKEQRNFAEARRLFGRAVEADPFNAPSWQAYALFEKEQRQYDEARRLFKRAVEADPFNAPSWQAYALFEKEQRQYDEARRLFKRAVEADPFDAPAWQAYALFEKEQRNFAEARRLFKRAVDADPSHAPSWQAYALFEKEQRNFAEARRLFGRAVEADPLDAPAWQAYALFEKEQRNFAEARRLFGRAVDADPLDAPAWQAYALFEKEQRNFAEARRLFKRAVEADPFNAPSWQAYALFEKEQRNFDEARRLFGRAVDADPFNAPSWQAYALFEKEQRNFAEARRLFGRAVEADPSHAPSWQAYALFEKEQRNFAEARRLLEEGLRRVYDGRGKGLLHSTLGGLLAGGGDLAAAESHFRKALEYDDRDALTHYHFATKVLLRTARRAEACRHLCRAKALRIKKPHERAMIEKAIERNGCQCGSSE